ncbi:hypothetical protein F5888DRAFT_1706680 [Russula emetica]|nr:hypothetical protein F5888DRAFT_1706680 [Russula emetica]
MRTGQGPGLPGLTALTLSTYEARASHIHEASLLFPFLRDLSSYPLSIATMSHSPSKATPHSEYEVIFDKALKTYEKKTGKVLNSDPLLPTLEACTSSDETLSELRRQIPGFDQSENSDNRLTNWVDPAVNVLYTFGQTIGGAVGLKSNHGAVIITGISSLLTVVMAVRTVQPAIVDLFESINRFFIRLKIYVKLPPMEEMTEIIVDVMVQVLHILALLTKEIKRGKIKRFLKKLIGRSDIEDALRRFEKLTQEESRMVTVQNLKTAHGV